MMFGRQRFTKGEKIRRSQIDEAYRQAIQNHPDVMEELPGDLRPQSRYLQGFAGAPVYKGTDVTFFPLGEDMFAEMLRQLEQAKKYIFLEYFIIAPGKMWDSILEILKRKAALGVDVRVVYDDIGSFGLLPRHYARELERAGISCLVFNPFTNIFSSRFNNRDHRKICVIDGNVGFTGGANLADEYINAYPKHGHWKDTAVMLRGEGVFSLTVMFLSLWDYERKIKEDFSRFSPTVTRQGEGFVQPYTDSPADGEYVGETVYENMLGRAKDYVYITSPYLIIDNTMIAALTSAAKSGVDVRIITPGIPDKKTVFLLTRSYYNVLLEAGVKIYEYTPGFVHAKEFVSDDRTAVVGTINLDYRSLCHHYECGVWMCENKAVLEIKEDFLKTLTQCREITPELCRKILGKRPLLLAILRIFAPLF